MLTDQQAVLVARTRQGMRELDGAVRAASRAGDDDAVRGLLARREEARALLEAVFREAAAAETERLMTSRPRPGH